MGEEEATLAETPCKLEVDGQFPTELRGTLRLSASFVTHVLLEGKQRRYPIGTVLRVEKHDQHRFWKKARPCVELLFTNGQKLTFSCRNDSTRQEFAAAVEKAIADHDSRYVLGQLSESTRHLMGTGASLLVLPDGTTWPDGDLRDGMAACVESLTELQAKLMSAGAWTAENREGLSMALDHSRRVYSKLIDEAPAHREEMQKLRGTLLADFREGYDWVLEKFVKKQDGFAEFNAQAALCASKAPQHKPRQTTPQLEQLYESGAVNAREPFKRLLDAAGDKLADAKIEMAPLKKMTRTIEKSMLRPDAARRGEVDDILDVVRGMVICGSMRELGVALTFFSEVNHGWKIVRVKNRFTEPTSGGWADCLLNIVRSDDPHQHVCEVQLVHKKMLVLRGEDLGGHDAYNQYRRADELLLVLNEKDVFAPVRKDVFAPVRRAVGMLKGLGVVTPRTPDLPRIGAGASSRSDTQKALLSRPIARSRIASAARRRR